MRAKSLFATLFSLSMSPLSTKLLKKLSSSGQRSITVRIMYFTMSSAVSRYPFRSQKAISGSIIQNSAAWRAV